MLLQFLHIINLCCLLLSTTGVVMHQHFCQDKLKSFSVFGRSTKSCCKDEKKISLIGCSDKKEKGLHFHKKDCCQNKILLSKVENTKQNLPLIDLPNASVFYFPIPKNNFFVLKNYNMSYMPYNEVLRYYSMKAPPPIFHILFSVFRC